MSGQALGSNVLGHAPRGNPAELLLASKALIAERAGALRTVTLRCSQSQGRLSSCSPLRDRALPASEPLHAQSEPSAAAHGAAQQSCCSVLQPPPAVYACAAAAPDNPQLAGAQLHVLPAHNKAHAHFSISVICHTVQRAALCLQCT